MIIYYQFYSYKSICDYPVGKVGFCKVRNCFSYFHSLSSTKNVKQYLISNNEQKDNPCVSIEENFQLDHTGTNEQDLDMLMNDSTEDFDNLFNKNKKSIMRKIVGKWEVREIHLRATRQ